MPKRAKSKPARAALSKDRVLDAAIKIADAEGVAALSMRKLAEALGVQAMSLYNHVGGKDEILDGLVERVMTKIEVPRDEADWWAAMHARATSLHEALLAHPWAAALAESRTTLGPVRLALNDAVIGSLRGGGFSIHAAYKAFLVLDSYIYGFVLQEVNWPFDPTERAHIQDHFGPMIPKELYPNIAAAMEHVLSTPIPNDRATAYVQEFNFGLELILNGLRATLGA